MIDLHIHTTFSDGALSPESIIDLALERNLKSIAITDHDTVNGLVYLSDNNIPNKNLEIINGIEFSSEYKGIEIHLLGYFIDIYDKELRDFLKGLEASRDARNKALVEKLNSIGLDITMEFVASLSTEALVTKAHFGQALVEKKYCKTNKEAFDLYLGKGKPGDVERSLLDYKKSIELITNAGGVTVLAHPMLYKLSNKEIEDMVKGLKEDGLFGLECYYSSHQATQTNFLKGLAEKYDLLETAGSDFHGPARTEVLGHMNLGNQVGSEVLDNIKEKAKH